MMTRLSRMIVAAAAIGVGAGVAVGAPAGALGLTAFSMSPTSGPGGTDVSVSGTGCAPGLLLSSSLDHVVVTVASVPPVSVQVPVSSGGAWSGTVTIRANAAAGQALVTALCVTDGLQSLLTIYQPLTFTVTAAAAPTTTAAPTTPETAPQPPDTVPPPAGGTTPATRPGATQTTQPSSDGGGGGDGGSVAGPGSDSTSPGAGSSDPGSSGGGATTGTKPGASGAKHADALAVAADLRTPNLGSGDVSGGGHGLGWIGWLALALLVAGFVVGSLLFRRYRRDDEPAEA